MKGLRQKSTVTVLGIVLTSLLVGLAFPNGFRDANRPPNFIGVVELAEKIRNREDFLLIDLREATLYEEFHIPSAQNKPFSKLNVEELEGTIIFYSGDDLVARQAWNAMPDRLRSRSRILYGGVHDWYSRLLYPTLPFGAKVEDRVVLDRVHELSNFYGGYADFKDDPNLMNYYRINLQQASWPKYNRSGTLVRKGC